MTGRRSVVAGAAAVLTAASMALGVAPAGASHGASPGGPSAAAVRQSRAQVATREHQVALAARRIARARARAQSLGTAADAASEVYDGARVTLQAARRSLRTARLVLDGADQRVALGQAAVASFAAAAYETGGMSTVDAFLTSDGPARLVSRVGAIGAIASSQRDTLEQLDAATVYQGVVRRQAQVVAGRASAAATAANQARLAAQAAADRQNAVLAGLRRDRHRLATLLHRARAHASRLEQARLAAILAARQAAARRAAAARARRAQAAAPAPASPPAPGPTGSPFAGGSGSTSGTVSAATAAAAVKQAEAQIGKPYQWGAAGPATFDCSGLVMWSYAQVGVHLDHWTGFQWTEGAHVGRAQLRPGDLVFFAYNTADPSTIHHVGMYIGGGQMVEAPYTGANVRISGAFRPDYIGAVRPYQR